MLYLSTIIFYMIPFMILAFFVTSLVMFIVAKRKNKKQPGTYTDMQIKARMILLITSSCLVCTILAIVLFLAILMAMALAYM